MSPIYQDRVSHDREQYVLLRTAKTLGADLIPVARHHAIDGVFNIDGTKWSVEVKSRHPKHRKAIEDGGVLLSYHKWQNLTRLLPSMLVISFGYGDTYVYRITKPVHLPVHELNYVHHIAKREKTGDVVYVPWDRFEKII